MTAWCDEGGGFCNRAILAPCVHVQACEQSRVGCVLHTRHLIDSKRNPTATTKKFNYELFMDCENSDKIRVSPFMVTVLSFIVLPQNSG